MMKPGLLLTLLIFFLPVDAVVITAVASPVNFEKASPENAQQISGKVNEVIISAGFSYVQIDTGVKKVWAVRPGSTTLKKGDVTAFTADIQQHNFHSSSLNRDFSTIYFIKRFSTDKESPVTAGQAVQGKSASTVSTVTTGEVQVGEKLRDVWLDGLNGEDEKISDFKGKPLIINVWASWCGPCRAEMKSLKNLAQRYNNKQFTLIGISTDDYRSRAAAFIRKTGIQFKNFLDNKLQSENMLGASTLPLTVFVDKDGKVLAKVRGSRQWDNPEMIDAIAKVLGVKLSH